MIRLALMYSGCKVGSAFVDDDLEPLSTINLSLALPRNLYRVSQNRPDVILALLQEDETLLPRCHPFISYHKTQIRLAHIAIKPEIVPLIADALSNSAYIRSTINRLRSTIARLAYANSDRTDCRRENLRELIGDPS